MKKIISLIYLFFMIFSNCYIKNNIKAETMYNIVQNLDLQNQEEVYVYINNQLDLLYNAKVKELKIKTFEYNHENQSCLIEIEFYMYNKQNHLQIYLKNEETKENNFFKEKNNLLLIGLSIPLFISIVIVIKNKRH